MQIGKDFRDLLELLNRHQALEVPVLDRASLIANKRALGRPHDLDDAKDLDR